MVSSGSLLSVGISVYEKCWYVCVCVCVCVCDGDVFA